MLNKRMPGISFIVGCGLAAYFLVSVPDVFSFLDGSSYVIGFTEIARRLLVYLPVYAGGCYLWERQMECASLRIFRYRRILAWWVSGQSAVFACLAVSYGAMTAGLCMAERRELCIQDGWTLLLVFVHALFLYAVAVVLRMNSGSMVISSAIIIFAESLGLNLLANLRIPPACISAAWGIYGYASTLYGQGGFPVIICLVGQVAVVAGVWFIFPFIRHRLPMRGL